VSDVKPACPLFSRCSTFAQTDRVLRKICEQDVALRTQRRKFLSENKGRVNRVPVPSAFIEKTGTAEPQHFQFQQTFLTTFCIASSWRIAVEFSPRPQK